MVYTQNCKLVVAARTGARGEGWSEIDGDDDDGDRAHDTDVPTSAHLVCDI